MTDLMQRFALDALDGQRAADVVRRLWPSTTRVRAAPGGLTAPSRRETAVRTSTSR